LAADFRDDRPRRRVEQHAGARAGARVPPHNLQAEESLLGAMLLSKDAIAAAVEVVGADDFYKPAHGHVFEAITSLFGGGEPVDPVTVAEELSRAGLLDAIGGPATLVSIQANTPATTSASRYARIVEEHALLRRLIGVAGEIAELGYDVPDDVAKVVDRAESLVFEVAQRRVTDTIEKLGNLLSASLDRLEHLYERGEQITGVPTGYVDLDEMLAGLQPSNLVVVGARPSMGKCVRYDTKIVDPATGALRTIADVHRAGVRGDAVRVAAIDGAGTLVDAVPSDFVDDGVKPVYRVRTRLGRVVNVTLSHPFLTPAGWRPLEEIAVGSRIAVPRILPCFGRDRLPDAEVKLLGHLLSDSGSCATSVLITTTSEGVRDDVASALADMGCELRRRAPAGPATTYALVGAGEPSPIVDMLRRHSLLGATAHTKFVPEAVFRLPREQVATFLSRLFGGDGSAWWSDSPRGDGRISYRCVSPRLARDVQHLLVRFGLNARLRPTRVPYAGSRRLAYEVELTRADEIGRFATEIGIFGKERHVANLVRHLDEKRPPFMSFGGGGLSVPGTPTATGEPRRRAQTVRSVAVAVDPSPPHAETDIAWDEVVEITYDGEHQVYDLTVPELHNFVADDVIVHNTSFALGLASHAAVEANYPVLVFSLEMSQVELSQRVLCAEARVDSTRVRTGRLTEGDWSKISHAVGRLAEAPLFIDDNPNITVMEIRAKARRLKSRIGKLGLIVIDYVQLMSGRSNAENRQVEVSEISRSLKILARELECPVVALAQLNRQLEQRADKRPMLADLRESGSLEQDADVVLFLYRDEVYHADTPDRGTAEVLVAKHRNGPTGKVRLAWLDHYTRFANMAKGG
jgi:replicative DNA helicase